VDYVIVREFALRHRRDRTALKKPAPTPHTADDHARQYAASLLAQAREELTRVDTKASIMLAAVGVALGVVLGDLVSRGWSPFRLPFAAVLVWWVGVATVSVGIVSLLAAVYPRHRRQMSSSAGEPQEYVGYYADVATYRSVAEVINAIKRSAGRDLELIAEQLLQVSRIADRKYRLVSWGVWLLVIGVACALSALLINAA
jgi:hypothetical protein